MHKTVSLKIEIDARASLCEMERRIQQAGRELMKEGPKQALSLPRRGQEKTCPHRGSERVQLQGTKRRVLLTSFGQIEGSAIETAALEALWPSVSPGGAMFGRGQKAKRHNVYRILIWMDLAIQRAARHELDSLTVWKDLIPNRAQESLLIHSC